MLPNLHLLVINYYTNIRCSGLIFPMPVLVTCWAVYSLSKTVYLGHQPVMQSLVVHPPKKSPGSTPALHVLPKKTRDPAVACFPMLGTDYIFSHTTLNRHVFGHWLHVSLQMICPTPKKG